MNRSHVVIFGRLKDTEKKGMFSSIPFLPFFFLRLSSKGIIIEQKQQRIWYLHR